jgi:hypothetical protein
MKIMEIRKSGIAGANGNKPRVSDRDARVFLAGVSRGASAQTIETALDDRKLIA